MGPALPLADAQRRLGKPGRPRKPTLEQQAATVGSSVQPGRLLGVRGTAIYLGIGVRNVYELKAAGHLHPVRVPMAGDRELNRLLFDRQDLDALIERWKEPAR